jgi:hypothetical protein
MTGSTQITTAELGRREPLGRGGTALVYRVPDLRLPELPGTTFVYKEYKASILKKAGPALTPGLENLVRFRGKLPDRQRAAWDARIIWPTRLVVDDAGEAAGIIMPLIPPRFFHDFQKRTGEVRRDPREIDTLFGDPDALRRAGLPPVDIPTRLSVVREIAYAYAMMHRGKIVLGDISGRNVLYDPNPTKPTIVVVDVDSARQIGTKSPFGLQPHTPNWEPPNALDASRMLQSKSLTATMSGPDRTRLENTRWTQSTETDVYKFALIVLRALDFGRGATFRRDPAVAVKVLRQHLGADAADLLPRSLSRHDADRPLMKEWYFALERGTGGAPTRQQPSARTWPKVPLLTRRAPSPATTPTPRTAPAGDGGLQVGERRGSFVWDGSGWVRQ